VASKSNQETQRSTILYDNRTYDITDLQYPVDLGAEAGNQYGKNKVLFLINVISESKIKSSSRELGMYDLSETEQKRSAGQKIADIGAGVASKFTENSNPVIKEAFRMASPSKISKRLKAAISLYVPNSVRFSYGVQWGEEDLSGAENKADIVNDVLSGGLNKQTAKALGEDIIRQVQRKILTDNPAIQSAFRQTPGNAKAAQLFQGVDFRTFTFNYSFLPRSQEEADSVLKIIRTFRHHMLPEFKDDSQFLFIYPSQFEIKYLYENNDNEFLEKHFTAVLTNCDIDYTPNGQFTTFDNGMPSQIDMSLTFKELSLATKESSPDNRSGT
jgi:Tail-tube assembly protein